MLYFNPINENGITYSCDNIRIAFDLNPLREDNFCLYLEIGIQFESLAQSNTPYKYRYLVSAKYGKDASMTIGFSFNGSNRQIDKYKGFLDFNPNKVAHSDQFWGDFYFITSCCRIYEIKRIDVAIDIPVKRDYMILNKDKRKYSLDMYSLPNRTEYLGQRSNVGFVKLYNKTIEDRLDYDLTRLEITSEPETEKILSYIPDVYDISKPFQLGIDIESLTDTERWILKAEDERLIENKDPGLAEFKRLGRKMRDKLAPYLLTEECKFKPSRTAISSMIEVLYAYFKSY